MAVPAFDFRAECSALYTLISTLPDFGWESPTQFKGWTVNDVLGHLHLFDVAAGITLESREKVQAFFGEIMAARGRGTTLLAYTRQWLQDCAGAALRERWYAYARELSFRFEDEDPQRRVAWGGPDMSVRSCISARQMETWSHAQAVFDLLGVERLESDRLRNIAVIGINTFVWSFRNRGLPVPERKPFLRLASPSGTLWQWNEDEDEHSIEGSAVDFCRVVTQTRNVADTSLSVRGEIAERWMSIAQCFAGPPVDPPAPGTRFCQPRRKK